MVIRLASRGRVSTEGRQDLASSRAWQPARATALVGPNGEQIVEEFFDVGQSHSVRPSVGQKCARFCPLWLTRAADLTRVVAGEVQRASWGSQFGNTFTLESLPATLRRCSAHSWTSPLRTLQALGTGGCRPCTGSGWSGLHAQPGGSGDERRQSR